MMPEDILNIHYDIMTDLTFCRNEIYASVLEKLIADLPEIKGDSERAVKNAVHNHIQHTIETLEGLSHRSPIDLPLNLDISKNIQNIIDAISKKANENELAGRFAPNIAYGAFFEDIIGGNRFISPGYIDGLELYRNYGNIVVSYEPDQKEEAIERLNNIVFSLILSLPPKKSRLSIVDFGLDGSASLFTKNLSPGFYHDEVVVDQTSYSNLLTRLQKQLSSRQKQYGNWVTYNETKHCICEPVEIVLLLGDPDRFDYHWNELLPLWENGRKGGIFFIVLKDLSRVPEKDYVMAALSGLDYLNVNPIHPQYKIENEDTVRLTAISQVPRLARSCFEYLNTGFNAKDEAVKIIDTNQINEEYEDCLNGVMEVEIGRENKSVSNFKLDLVSHIHAFILGMSGSGKSVLLHNIIANLIGKYSPEQLELYLLDFKLGGVEFNRYRDTKHLKALLVDNSDNSVVLEILRELNTAMYERGKLLKAANVQRIDEYNRVNPDNPMPQILTVIDECHNIFNLEGGRQTGIQREVLSILTKITKEGRNQGVHIVMATQTLSGADIPGEILNNISDHYLLKCAQSDSERLAPGSSNITFGLPTGKIFYHHQSGSDLFQGYYIGDTELQSKVLQANQKASERKSNGQFYFSGSQIFKLTKEIAGKIYSEDVLTLTPGETCSLRHKPVDIKLQNQDAQNILVSGIDLSMSMRSTLALVESAIMHNEKSLQKYNIAVINCLDANNQLKYWENKGLIFLAESKEERAELIGRLANDIECGGKMPTLLVIIGQQLFRELKKDMSIVCTVEKKPEVSPEKSCKAISDLELKLDIPDLPEAKKEVDFGFDIADADFAIIEKNDENNPETPSEKHECPVIETSFGKALRTILQQGPEQAVHTIMQIDKPSNILFEEYPGKKMIYSMFSHILIHRSDEGTASTFGLRDNIRPENLTSDEDRLKAIYFNEEADTYLTYSPYIIESNEIK